MLAAGCPAPCSNTLRIDPRSTLRASASRSSFSSGDAASRVNTSATNSIGAELARRRPSCETRATAPAPLPPDPPCPVPVQSSDRENSFPSRSRSVEERAPAPAVLLRRQRQLFSRLPIDRYETVRFRWACCPDSFSQSRFAAAPVPPAIPDQHFASITTESASALTFHDGFAARSEAAAISAVSGVPS